tara:strand:+ start:184 stop:396 length:213 start_codon:yes stop_codon:yes gene_type:complete
MIPKLAKVLGLTGLLLSGSLVKAKPDVNFNPFPPEEFSRTAMVDSDLPHSEVNSLGKKQLEELSPLFRLT